MDRPLLSPVSAGGATHAYGALFGSWALRHRDAVAALGGGMAALLLYLHTLAPSITLANGAGDSGELASTAFSLGIAHPTGYPLYTMLGFAITHLGGGEPAFALNVFSALMGGVTVGLLLLLTLRLVRRAAPEAPWPLGLLACGLGVSALAVSTNFWTEAVVTETRTLALALDALILCLLIVPARLTARYACAAGLCYGLALCDHLLSLYLAPAVVVLVVPWAGASARRWLAILGFLCCGLAPYLYLPLRAAAQPVANWGNPDTPARFLWVVSGQEYRYEMFQLGPTAYPAAVGASLQMLWQQLNSATIACAMVGLVGLLPRAPRVAAALVLSLSADIALTSAYSADAAPTYLLLGGLLLAPLAAAGWLILGNAALRLLRRQGATAGIALAAVCAAGLVTFGWTERPALAAARAAVALSSTPVVRDSGVAVLRSLPRRAVIFASGDDASVPLWYAQRGLGLRPDVTIVATGLLTFSWYYKQIRRLPAFDRRLLPDSDASIDDGTDFTLIYGRTALLARAVAPGHPLFVASPDPALAPLCRQIPYGRVYQCRS